MTPVNAEFVVLEGKTVTDGTGVVREQGYVFTLDPASEETKRLVDGGFIAPVQVADEDELEDYVVTEEFLKENPAIAESGVVVGETIKVPKADDTALEDEQPAAADETAAEEKPAEEAAPEAAAEESVVADDETVQLSYMGKRVISDDMRVVNDRELHHVRLEDGTEADVSDEDYEAMRAQAGLTA